MDASFQNIRPQAGIPAMALDAETRTDSEPVTEIFTANSQVAPPACRLVYLLSRYPAVSHTFFLSEVRELRKLGFAVETASINQPDRPLSSMPAVEAEETGKTLYIKSTRPIRAGWIAAKTLLLRPRVFGRGLAAALRMGRWDPSATLYNLF